MKSSFIKAVAAGAMLTLGISSALAAKNQSEFNPYSPQYQHPYRHGVIPTLGQHQKMKEWKAAHTNRSTQATGTNTLYYRGGTSSHVWSAYAPCRAI